MDLAEEEEFSIEDILKETIPIAHRKYLTNDGIGFGTPTQRQKQYQAFRVNCASRMVSDYKIQKLQRETEGSKMLAVKEYAKRSKSSHFVDRVVEDLIQESMARGELNDLKGGKIESTAVPYVDQHDYHLNRVLANNGYVPEWVQAKKDIEKSLTDARDMLLKEKVRFHTPPCSDVSAARWQEKRDAFLESVRAINADIQVFNLITPLPKTQMLLLVGDKELARVDQMYDIRRLLDEANQGIVQEKDSSDSSRSIFEAVKQFLSI